MSLFVGHFVFSLAEPSAFSSENSGSKEESIPLKTKPVSAGPPVDEDAAAGDS